MTVRVTPDQYVEKHARRLKAATQDIRAGVERLQENPCEKAADAEEKMLAGITNAVQSGKWARGLRKVSLPEWKRKMLEVGVNRIPQGIDGAAPKVKAFAQQLLPAVENAQAEIAGMSNLTLEDNIARMVAYTRKMAEFQKE